VGKFLSSKRKWDKGMKTFPVPVIRESISDGGGRVRKGDLPARRKY